MEGFFVCAHTATHAVAFPFLAHAIPRKGVCPTPHLVAYLQGQFSRAYITQEPFMGFSVGRLNTEPLLSAATATGAGSSVQSVAGVKTYQANGTTTAGAGTATILVQGSNDGTNWDTIGTISLTLATTTSSDSFISDDRYAYVRGNVSGLTGTGASVNLTMGF